MGPNRFGVYTPAHAGLPFLSVMIPPHGYIQVQGFETAAQAEEHNSHAQALIAPKIALRPESSIAWEMAAGVFLIRASDSSLSEH